jgi:hypothetical protein
MHKRTAHCRPQNPQGTNFLLYLASFECFGIALVEANAFGVLVATNNHYVME